MKHDAETAASAIVEAAACQKNFEGLMGSLAPLFARVEPRRTAAGYVAGLLADLPRRSWQLAEHGGHVAPDKMHRLLERAIWDTFAAMPVVREFVVEHLGDPDATVVFDETGQEKKGQAAMRVARQYTGAVGKVTNSVNAVYASYATAAGHALVAGRLYLHASWVDGPARREQAGVPDDVALATKPKLAVQMLGRDARRRDAGRLGRRRCRLRP